MPDSGIAMTQDRTLLEDFLAALRDEQSALLERDVDRLGALVERKLACARRLEAEASPGLGDALRDTQARLRRGDAPAGEGAGALYALVREAAELNRVNGVLIDQQLGQVRLSLARIEPATGQRSLYGSDGQGRFGTPGRSFGAA